MSVSGPSVNASTVQVGQYVEYMSSVAQVREVNDRRPGPKGGHFAHVVLSDGRSVGLKPGHALPLKEV